MSRKDDEMPTINELLRSQHAGYHINSPALHEKMPPIEVPGVLETDDDGHASGIFSGVRGFRVFHEILTNNCCGD